MRVSQSGNNQVASTEAGGARKAEGAGKAEKAYKKKAADRADGASASAAGAASADISARGKEMAKAKEAASSAPDVREAKIAELRKRIAEGKYNVDSDAVASRMVDEHLAAGIG